VSGSELTKHLYLWIFYYHVSTITASVNVSSSNLTIHGSMEFRTLGSCEITTCARQWPVFWRFPAVVGSLSIWKSAVSSNPVFTTYSLYCFQWKISTIFSLLPTFAQEIIQYSLLLTSTHYLRIDWLIPWGAKPIKYICNKTAANHTDPVWVMWPMNSVEARSKQLHFIALLQHIPPNQIQPLVSRINIT
jgi:hypothetical protein